MYFTFYIMIMLIQLIVYIFYFFFFEDEIKLNERHYTQTWNTLISSEVYL